MHKKSLRTRAISRIQVSIRSPARAASLLRRCQCPRHPVEALVEAIASGGTRRLDEPLAIAHVVQAELLGDRGRILSWPPTSQTVKLMFLYSTVSTLKPMVGMVVTTSPSLSL